MRRTRTVLLTLAMGLPHCASAAAQGAAVDIGAGAGLLGDGFPAAVPTLDLQISGRVNVSTRLEGFVNLIELNNPEGLWGVVVNHHLSNDANSRTEVFFSIGGAGSYSIQRPHTYRYTDGSGRAVAYRAAGSFDMTPPFALLVGGAVQHGFSNRTALRFEAHAVLLRFFMPVGVRTVGVIAVPLWR